MIAGRLICKLFGHKWRRLTKNESIQPLPITQEIAAMPDLKARLRICRRCNAARIVKQRKNSAAQASPSAVPGGPPPPAAGPDAADQP